MTSAAGRPTWACFPCAWRARCDNVGVDPEGYIAVRGDDRLPTM
jgi:hypothetical protein